MSETYAVSSGMTSSGLVLGSGDWEIVYSGGVASNTVVHRSGNLVIDDGRAIGTVVSGGFVSGLRVSSGTVPAVDPWCVSTVGAVGVKSSN